MKIKLKFCPNWKAKQPGGYGWWDLYSDCIPEHHKDSNFISGMYQEVWKTTERLVKCRGRTKAVLIKHKPTIQGPVGDIP